MHLWTNRITGAAVVLAILLSATVCRSQTCAEMCACGENCSSESLVTFEINCGTSVVVTWQISSEAYDYFTDVDVQLEYNCTDTRGHSEAKVLVPKSNVMAGIPGRWSQGTTCRVWGCLFPLCHDCPLCLTIAEQSCSVPLVTSAATRVTTGAFVEDVTYPSYAAPTVTMTAGSPAEPMMAIAVVPILVITALVVILLAATTMAMIALSVRRRIVRLTDVVERVEVQLPFPQHLDAVLLESLPNVENNDVSFSIALVASVPNGSEDGMGLDKNARDGYVDECMFA